MLFIVRCTNLFLIGISTLLAADITATTEDGKKVLLQGNGSWRFITEEAPITELVSSKTVALIELFKNDVRYDFRKIRWDMSRKEVMGSEETKPVKNSGDSLCYEVSFLGYNCSVVYLFAKEILKRAVFIVRQDHVDPALFFKDYEELKKYLTPIYGNAVTDKNDWINDIYRSDRTKWGFAVSIGFLNCRTEWHNARTRIVLAIGGGSHQILTNVEYSGL